MKTKVTIWGDEPKKKLTPIEFLKILVVDYSDAGDSFEIIDASAKPSDFYSIVLLSKNYEGSGMDLMFANEFSGGNGSECLYLGHFNDGIV